MAKVLIAITVLKARFLGKRGLTSYLFLQQNGAKRWDSLV